MRTSAFYPISKGDRVYVRVIQERRTVLEFSIDRVADMTELIGEIRYAASGLDGLATVVIRNHSRGWSRERPMMFYSAFPSPRRREFHEAMREASASLRAGGESREMLFPWETH